MRWLAAFLAVSFSNLIGVVTVALAISLSEGSLGVPKLRQMVAVSSVVAITNTSIALLAVIIIVADSRAVWLLTLPIATLFLGYRAFIGAKQQHESLELLYESTRILQRTPELDSALVQLLYHSRTMFRAEQAEIVLFPSAPGRQLPDHVGGRGTHFGHGRGIGGGVAPCPPARRGAR